MTEILDRSYDNDTGEITQFLVMDDGQPETKLATPENLLLFDPENELPFDGGMHEFLDGGTALKLSEDPEVVVSQSGDAYSYVLSIRGSVVETTRSQAERVLRGVYKAMAENDSTSLESLHEHILKNQVRRSVVNVLAQTFEESHRITVVSNGWLVDGFYLVDWDANMYTSENDPDEGDYIRGSDGVVQKDESYELVRFRQSISQIDENATVTIGGDDVKVTERELLFLGKIKWLLHRRHYHPDKPFWMFTDRWADVDVETGEPEMEERPNLDQFDI